jgi:hypothetical protein
MLNTSPLPVSPDPTRGAPAYGPIDWSALETFTACAKRFRLACLEGTAEEFRTVDALVDETVRETLAWLAMSGLHGEHPGEAAVVAFLHALWRQHLGPHVRVVRAGDRIEAFAHRTALIVRRACQAWPLVPGLRIEGANRRFQLRLRGRHDLLVRADLLGHDNDGTLHVAGYEVLPQARWRSPQLDGLHAAGLAVLLQRRVPSVRLVRVRLTDGHRDDETVTRFDAARLASAIGDRLDALRTATQHTASPSVGCASCGFRSSCEESGLAARFVGLPELGSCPKCRSDLGLRNGRLGVFITCRRYPDCRYSRDL